MSRVIHTHIKDEAQMIRRLKEEGYFNIFVWEDRAGTRYAEHTHPHHEVRWVISGVLEIEEEGRVVRLEPGDRLESPPHTPHSAYVPQTVRYVCASR